MHPSTVDASVAFRAAEASIGYCFRSEALLRRALTHRSEGSREHYELLEFLGDAVLELLAREMLIEVFPDEEEGELTRRKRSLVSSRALSAAGRRLGLDRCVLAGEGLKSVSRAMTADVVESLCGAVFMEAGFETARSVIRKTILVPLLESGSDPGADPRSRLQEICQARSWPSPAYRVGRSGGTEHEPVFEAVVSLEGGTSGSGTGATKKEAQSAAALDALDRIEGGG